MDNDPTFDPLLDNCQALLTFLLALRLAILQGSLPKFSQQDNPAAFHPSLYVRVSTFCYLAAFNWWLLLCPATLSHDWQMGSIPLVTSWTDARNLVTCFFFGMTSLLAIRTFMDFESQRHPPIVLGLMLLVIPFLPATNLLVTVGFVVAERVLYIPSLGSILLVVYGVQTMWYTYWNHRQTISCFVMLLLTTGCLRTVMRNRDWTSRESLLRAGLTTLPHNAKMHYNYANFLRDSARPELAKSHYYMALKLWPSYASAHNNLGTLLNDSQEAEQHFLEAIKYSADHANAHYNLGILYRKSNKSVESERMLRKCIILEPTFTSAYIELAKLRGLGDRGLLHLLKKVAELNPFDPYYSATFGHWLNKKGAHQQAAFYYWKSLRISPYYQKAFIGLAKLLRKFGQKSKLLQLITRWQLVRRMKKGELAVSPHLYLWGWQLKSELTNKAKAYDIEAQLDNTLVEQSAKTKNHSADELRLLHTQWSNKRKNRIQEESTKETQDSKLPKTKSSPFMVHHLLDSA